MWGLVIMIVFVFSVGKIEVDVYFLEGWWFDFIFGEFISEGDKKIVIVFVLRDKIFVFV